MLCTSHGTTVVSINQAKIQAMMQSVHAVYSEARDRSIGYNSIYGQDRKPANYVNGDSQAKHLLILRK